MRCECVYLRLCTYLVKRQTSLYTFVFEAETLIKSESMLSVGYIRSEGTGCVQRQSADGQLIN